MLCGFSFFFSLKKKKQKEKSKDSTVDCQAVRLQGIQCSQLCGDTGQDGDKLDVWVAWRPGTTCSGVFCLYKGPRMQLPLCTGPGQPCGEERLKKSRTVFQSFCFLGHHRVVGSLGSTGGGGEWGACLGANLGCGGGGQPTQLSRCLFPVLSTSFVPTAGVSSPQPKGEAVRGLQACTKL